jgi:hypothetical protein
LVLPVPVRIAVAPIEWALLAFAQYPEIVAYSSLQAYLGYRNIQHTVGYTRFKNLWHD